MRELARQDLEHVLRHTERLWEALRGRRLFISGGTGFFGCWLLETFAWANEKLDLGAEALVLTRSPEAFARKAPHVAGHPAIRLLAGDVAGFAFPEGEFSHVIHAATQPAPSPDPAGQVAQFEREVAGTRGVLEFARARGVRRLLFTSSGAVYGTQPPEMERIPDEYAGAPDTLSAGTAYGQAKRVSEYLCAAHAAAAGFDALVARCFAFVGPHVPLDGGFAVGNFVGDVLGGRPVRVKGDGTPYRSYLYAADLAVWLWTILFRGQPGRPYNVGSEEAVTIRDLAGEVAGLGGSPVVVAQEPVPGALAPRYVPSTARAREELGLREWIGRAEGIRRMLEWCRRSGGTGEGGGWQR